MGNAEYMGSLPLTFNCQTALFSVQPQFFQRFNKMKIFSIVFAALLFISALVVTEAKPQAWCSGPTCPPYGQSKGCSIQGGTLVRLRDGNTWKCIRRSLG